MCRNICRFIIYLNYYKKGFRLKTESVPIRVSVVTSMSTEYTIK